MFGIFNKIAKNVKPFEEYMEYIFELKYFKNEEKVTTWDLLHCDLMFPTRRDIIQSSPMTVELGIHAAIIFREELQDKSNATTKYCSAIRGANRMKKVSEEE